ncbi:MAG: 2'-5' RNA ligase family protein [Chloroflexi bacterium]|nr:2'-5' RNA ligase family protein [Chloroflexota bacterium]
MPDFEQAYTATWQQFSELPHTRDTLVLRHRRFRQWMLGSYITFIVPINDFRVIDRLAAWQHAFESWFQYDPQPPDRLHITLHHVGRLRRWPGLPLPETLPRRALSQITDRARTVLREFEPFTIGIGPLNAFSNVLFAEVHDTDRCLRTLRAKLRRALPLRARPVTEWPYLPHITLGHWGTQPAPPLVNAVQPYRQHEPVVMQVSDVELTLYNFERGPLERDLLEDAEEEIIAEFRLKAPDAG